MTTTDQTTTAYRVEFERVGRRRDVPPLEVTVPTGAGEADALAAQIHAYAGRFLGSSWYDVMVVLDEMRGSIECGRFGRFTFSEVA